MNESRPPILLLSLLAILACGAWATAGYLTGKKSADKWWRTHCGAPTPRLGDVLDPEAVHRSIRGGEDIAPMYEVDFGDHKLFLPARDFAKVMEAVSSSAEN